MTEQIRCPECGGPMQLRSVSADTEVVGPATVPVPPTGKTHTVEVVAIRGAAHFRCAHSYGYLVQVREFSAETWGRPGLTEFLRVMTEAILSQEGKQRDATTGASTPAPGGTDSPGTALPAGDE